MRDRREGVGSPVAMRAGNRSLCAYGLSLALAFLLLSCATPVPRGCSGEAAQRDGEPRRWHVRVLLSRDGSDERHEVVLRREDGRIEAIGLTPMGTQAWRLVHDDDGIDVENRIGRHLGLSPRLAYDATVQVHLVAGAGSRDVAEIERSACGYRARVVRIPDAPLTPKPPAPGEPPPP